MPDSKKHNFHSKCFFKLDCSSDVPQLISCPPAGGGIEIIMGTQSDPIKIIKNKVPEQKMSIGRMLGRCIPRQLPELGSWPIDACPWCKDIQSHTILCHSIPCHTMPYHTMPYHAMPYHVIPYHATACYTKVISV